MLSHESGSRINLLIILDTPLVELIVKILADQGFLTNMLSEGRVQCWRSSLRSITARILLFPLRSLTDLYDLSLFWGTARETLLLIEQNHNSLVLALERITLGPTVLAQFKESFGLISSGEADISKFDAKWSSLFWLIARKFSDKSHAINVVAVTRPMPVDHPLLSQYLTITICMSL